MAWVRALARFSAPRRLKECAGASSDAAIAELEQKRAQIDETLAELRVINAGCRRQVELRSRGGKPA